jgi:hypothetical protein
MKHLKRLVSAVWVTAALVAFVGAGSASATALYSGATKLGAGTETKWTVSGTIVVSTTEGVILDTCNAGSMSGKTENAGGATETVKSSIAGTGIAFTSCTFTTDTLRGGNSEVHWTSGLNGTLTASGVEATMNTGLFGSCAYGLGAGASLGTITGSTTGNATLDLNAVVSRISGLCPSTIKVSGTLTDTTPSKLHVTAS